MKNICERLFLNRLTSLNITCERLLLSFMLVVPILRFPASNKITSWIVCNSYSLFDVFRNSVDAKPTYLCCVIKMKTPQRKSRLWNLTLSRRRSVGLWNLTLSWRKSVLQKSGFYMIVISVMKELRTSPVLSYVNDLLN